MKRLLVLCLICLSLATGIAAQANVEILKFEDPEQDQRYHKLIAELRCLVCQNQNLADSNSDLAKDLRQQTYDMVLSGASNQDIVDYMVARYGDFVLYRPPLKQSTMLLWAGPFLFLLIALLIAIIVVVHSRRRGTAALTQEQQEAARRMLNSSDKDNA